MRNDRKARHRRLVELIEETVAQEGQEFEGYVWAARPLEDWAEMAGMSLATVKRLIAFAPIVRTSVQIEGVRAVLLRVGEPGPMTAREIANAMGRRYRKKYGQYPPILAYGHLNELAKQWPDGAQIEIFQTVLDEWPAFMSQVHIEEPDPKGRYYKWAVPSLINKFRHIGLDLYIMKKQEAFKPLPPSVVALNPKVYNPKVYKTV